MSAKLVLELYPHEAETIIRALEFMAGVQESVGSPMDAVYLTKDTQATVQRSLFGMKMREVREASA